MTVTFPKELQKLDFLQPLEPLKEYTVVAAEATLNSMQKMFRVRVSEHLPEGYVVVYSAQKAYLFRLNQGEMELLGHHFAQEKIYYEKKTETD